MSSSLLPLCVLVHLSDVLVLDVTVTHLIPEEMVQNALDQKN
jgi:hypothetical protein